MAGAGRAVPAHEPLGGHDFIYAEAELPGLKLPQLEITVTADNQLTLKGKREPTAPEKVEWHRQECGFGSFERTIELPVCVDAGKVEARLENGVLTIKISASRLARGRFGATGVDAGVARFFLAGMGHLLGLRVKSSGGTPVAPPHQGRRLTSTAPPPPGNSRQNPEVCGQRDRALLWRHCSSAGSGRPLELVPAPALFAPIKHSSNRQDLAK
jgi:hypothetical protein